MSATLKTKLGQSQHLGEKNDSLVAMVRLVREMQNTLEDNNLINSDDLTSIDNIIYKFLKVNCPLKVRDDLVEG